jgi:hypothetical protein
LRYAGNLLRRAGLSILLREGDDRPQRIFNGLRDHFSLHPAGATRIEDAKVLYIRWRPVGQHGRTDRLVLELPEDVAGKTFVTA